MRLIPTSITQKFTGSDPNDPTGGMTLDALMERQKMLQQQRPEIPTQIASPWQGASLMANSFVNSLQQAKVQAQQTAGRDLMAQTIAGIDPVKGATPEQEATLMRVDPETSMKYIADAMSARRAQIQQEHQDALTREGWSHQDAAAAASQAATAALTKEGWGHQDTAAETARQAAADAVTKEHQYQESQPQTDVGKLNADLKAGRISQEAYNAKLIQMGPDQYRPMTQQELKDWNIPTDPATGQPNVPYRFNIKENKPEAVGSQVQLVPAQDAAKLGMANVFAGNIDNISSNIEAGNLSGVGYVGSVSGLGAGAEARRQWLSGSEALVRLLTGAGMNPAEAKKQASQYEPAINDGPVNLHSKLKGLNDNLTAASLAAQQGRQPIFTPYGGKAFEVKREAPATTNAPATTRAPPPEAITELKADSSPQAQAEFDHTFGQGAAAKALGGK